MQFSSLSHLIRTLNTPVNVVFLFDFLLPPVTPHPTSIDLPVVIGIHAIFSKNLFPSVAWHFDGQEVGFIVNLSERGSYSVVWYGMVWYGMCVE